MGARGESKSVPGGSGSDPVGTGVGFGVRLRGVIGGATAAVVVAGVGVVLAGATPFQEGEGEVVKRLRLHRCRCSGHRETARHSPQMLNEEGGRKGCFICFCFGFETVSLESWGMNEHARVSLGS